MILSDRTYGYNGAKQTPTVTIKTKSGKTLRNNRDYVLSYDGDCIDAGIYTVTATGTGDYTGSIWMLFGISPASIDSASLSSTSYSYDGKTKTPSVTVKGAGGKTLVKDRDYTVSYSSGRVNAGTYKVTVTGKGNYQGTVTKSFTIKPTALGSAALSYTAYSYNGKVKTPSVTVKNSRGSKLVKDRDYTVSLSSGRKYIGSYKVTVKGKGNYTGSLTRSFTINPPTVSIKTPKAGSRKVTVSWNKASGGVYYQVAYRQSTSSSWKYTTTSSTSKTITGLTKGKYEYVKVRAYKKVSGKTYYGSWSSTKSVKVL